MAVEVAGLRLFAWSIDNTSRVRDGYTRSGTHGLGDRFYGETWLVFPPLSVVPVSWLKGAYARSHTQFEP